MGLNLPQKTRVDFEIVFFHINLKLFINFIDFIMFDNNINLG